MCHGTFSANVTGATRTPATRTCLHTRGLRGPFRLVANPSRGPHHGWPNEGNWTPKAIAYPRHSKNPPNTPDRSAAEPALAVEPYTSVAISPDILSADCWRPGRRTLPTALHVSDDN
jgi:hypothetical protein